jgi:hypothetical protein
VENLHQTDRQAQPVSKRYPEATSKSHITNKLMVIRAQMGMTCPLDPRITDAMLDVRRQPQQRSIAIETYLAKISDVDRLGESELSTLWDHGWTRELDHHQPEVGDQGGRGQENEDESREPMPGHG